MQQTNKYKLNLIESSDPFLPDGLNANTRKMEDVMLAHEAKVEQRMDATDQRITVLEGFKFAYGTYTGSGADELIVNLGFHPHAVLIYETYTTRRSVLLTENTERSEMYGVALKENGFRVSGETYSGFHFYIAFA